MDGSDLYTLLIIALFAAAAATFLLLHFVTAPYGRYTRKGWGPALSSRWAWITMESPAVLTMLVMFATGPHRGGLAAVFFVAWQTHYVYRTYIYTLLMRGSRKEFPVLVAGMAIVFNLANGYVNGWHLFHGGRVYPPAWIYDPRFLVGMLLFVTGLLIHLSSDHILRTLRGPREQGYKIPRGCMFTYLSAPNYFGEIIQWCGWALATWSVAGLAFAVFTVANLLPRGLAHHRWYRDTFEDYPEERRAVIPFIL